MPYVAKNPEDYLGKPKVGTGECVALVEAAAGTPRATQWKKGVDVKGASIPKGTIIATFNAQGRYANKSSGNHAAIYLGQNSQGIQVIDQFRGVASHKRTIKFDDKKGASNNGNKFSVVN